MIRKEFLLTAFFLAFLGNQVFAQKEEPRNVAIFLYQGVEILDFSGPAEVFAATRVNGAPPFSVYTVAATADAIVSQGFIDVVPDYTIHKCPKPDIMVLPGGSTGASLENGEVISWVQQSATDIDVAMSVCTGAFLLAKAGLLDGKTATTWHGAIARFREFTPKTKVLEDTRFVDNGKIVTTAGVSAGIDGALHVVSKMLGEDVARATARYMEYDKWHPEEGFIIEPEELSLLKQGNLENLSLSENVYSGQLRNIAHNFMQDNKPVQATAVFELAAKEFPSALTFKDLGDVYWQNGRKSEAREKYIECIKKNQSDLEIIDRIGFDRAVTLFRELGKKGGMNENDMNRLGYTLLAANRTADAILIFELNAKTFPDSWNAYDSLAEAYGKNNETKRAIKYYKKSLALNPDNTNAKTMLGKLEATQ